MLSAPSTSLAARPRVRVGGMRGKTEDRASFRARMDAQQPTPGTAAPGPQASPSPSSAPTRRDNILAARSDGTFEAKRTAYNQQGLKTGHSMDEAGNISSTRMLLAAAPGGAAAPPAAASLSPQVSPSPTVNNSQPGQPPSTAQPSTPPQAARPGPLMRRVGQINGMPAPLAIEQARNPAASNVTRNVTPAVTPPSPSRPGGIMAAAGQAVKGMHTAMNSTSPFAIAPRAQAINQTLKSRPPAPAAPVPTARPIAGAGFTGPAGIAAAQQVVQQNRAERDASDLARYQAENAAGPPVHRESVMPSGKPYPFSAAGHGNAPTPPLPVRTGSIAARPPVMLAGARAEGGPVDAGKPYLVGEKGPEVVVPKADATVVPNHLVRSSPGEGGALTPPRRGGISLLGNRSRPRGTSMALAAAVQKLFPANTPAPAKPAAAPQSINPAASPGLPPLPPKPQAVAAMPSVRSGKAFGPNWKSSARPPAMAQTRDWRNPPKVAANLLVSR